MGITYNETRWENAFDYIVCPVCGNDDWAHLVYEGVFCDACNCKATLRPTNGDRGFIVDFDASHCWADTDDEDLIPFSESHGQEAYAKYMGTEEDGYSRQYLGVYAFMNDDVDYDVWSPAWDRADAAEA